LKLSFLIFIARLPELDAEPFFYPIAIVCRCAGLPRLAAEGLLLFCLIKKVTKKSRLGTDVG